MERDAHAAFGRIRLFLDDLNLVLGRLPTMPPIGLPDGRNHPFDQLEMQRAFFPHIPNLTVRRGRPTQRSKSWRKRYLQPIGCQSGKTTHIQLPVYPSKQRSAPSLNNNTFHKSEMHPAPFLDVQLENHVDSIIAPNSVEIQPDVYDSTNQYADNYIEHSDKRDADQSSLHLLEDKRYDEDQQDPFFLEEERDGEDQQDPHLLEEERDATDQQDPQLLEDSHETEDPQVQEPVFDMKNYSARDVNQWARTLSTDQFEQLRLLGPASRIESFRKYAITNLDRPTETLAQETSSTPQNQYVDATSDEANNLFLHSHHVNDQPDQSPRSSYYAHSDYSNTCLDENPDNTVVSDDGFDESYDNGSFDESGFDNGGSSNNDFDDGGSNNNDFDDGGSNNNDFDNGSSNFDDFDDGYGSTYY